MRVNRGDKDDRPSGGAVERGGGDNLRSRTDRGNQSDEDIGSSASRGGGGGEANEPPRGAGAADLDPTLDTTDHFGPGGGSSDNPDVTGTKDATED